MKKQKSEPDWKMFGQFVQKAVTLFTLVRDTLNAKGVDLVEALVWMVGEGRKALVAELLEPMAAKIVVSRPKPVITSIIVDLGKMPSMPFDDASVFKHYGSGTVTLEKRTDGLYIDGRRVTFHLSERQQNGKTIKGIELRVELTGKPVLNANVLDALYENPDLIPDDWKVYEQGRTRYVFFWGTIYRSSGGSQCVRCLCFIDGRWYRRYGWLGHVRGVRDPAAVST